jgi:hypothetical protein
MHAVLPSFLAVLPSLLAATSILFYGKIEYYKSIYPSKMDTVYVFTLDGAEWEDLVIYLSLEEAIAKSKSTLGCV